LHPSAPPRPRGQALGHTLAREDAGAPLKRHWMQFIFKDHQSRDKNASTVSRD